MVQVKYVEERNQKTFALLASAKRRLPAFCAAFFTGIADTTAPLTRLNYAYDLGVFFDYLRNDGFKIETVTDLENITISDIEAFAEHIGTTNGERGKMRKLSALRTFFAYYFKKGEITRNVLPNVDLPKQHNKNIIRLDDDERAKIINVAAVGTGLTPGQMRFHTHVGARDALILKFFLSTGMRISELVGLNVGDIDLKSGTFRITRKGGNETIMFLTHEMHDELEKYLASSPALDRPLFLNIQGARLGTRAIQNLVKKYAANAAPLKKISPHKLRSTFGTNLYKATHDIYAVAGVLGHQNVNTTKKHYAEMTEDMKRHAMELFETENN